MIQGSGFFIWKLYKLYPFEDTAKRLVDLGVKWVSIKMLDGVNWWNHTNSSGSYNGSPALLDEAIRVFKEYGIDVGGWGFLYTDGVLQSAQAIEVGKIIKRFGISHWLIDAEDVSVIGARWKTHPDRHALASSYMYWLDTPADFPVALCTYRYPSYHREFPYNEFINHPKNTFVAPQVYWMMSTNSGYQVRKSYYEYLQYSDKPFVPMGATFCEHGWCPTASQIEEFVDVSVNELNVSGYGFWVLEEALEHPDWLEAIQSDEPTPPPPPVPSPEYQKYKVVASALNVRSQIIPSRIYGAQPGTIYYPSRVWFAEPNGTEVVAIEKLKDGNNRWIRVGQRQWMAELYDGNVYLRTIN